VKPKLENKSPAQQRPRTAVVVGCMVFCECVQGEPPVLIHAARDAESAKTWAAGFNFANWVKALGDDPIDVQALRLVADND
jgi:hypothetical protein